MKSPFWLLTLTLPFYVLDQLTKELVLRFIAEDEIVPVIPGVFYLIRTYNTGAAFSMGQNNNWFFLILAAAVFVVLLALWFRGKFERPLTRVAIALLLAGIAGNLTDRIRHGHVIDFLDVVLPWYGHWPAFNVADSCICVAAGLLFIGALKEPKRSR